MTVFFPSGTILANGKPLTRRQTTLLSAYVQQEDYFIGTLTVREVLMFHVSTYPTTVLLHESVSCRSVKYYHPESSFSLHAVVFSIIILELTTKTYKYGHSMHGGHYASETCVVKQSYRLEPII